MLSLVSHVVGSFKFSGLSWWVSLFHGFSKVRSECSPWPPNCFLIGDFSPSPSHHCHTGWLPGFSGEDRFRLELDADICRWFPHAHLPIRPGRVEALSIAWWLGQTMLAPVQCLSNHWDGHSSVWSMRFSPGSLPAPHSLALPWTQGAPPCHVSSYLASSTLNTHMAALCSQDVTSQPYKFCP